MIHFLVYNFQDIRVFKGEGCKLVDSCIRLRCSISNSDFCLVDIAMPFLFLVTTIIILKKRFKDKKLMVRVDKIASLKLANSYNYIQNYS